MKWISVEDKLPDYEKSVLIKTCQGVVQGYLFLDREWSGIKGKYLKCDSWQDEYHDEFVEYLDVTHWMPLPEPPQ